MRPQSASQPSHSQLPEAALANPESLPNTTNPFQAIGVPLPAVTHVHRPSCSPGLIRTETSLSWPPMPSESGLAGDRLQSGAFTAKFCRCQASHATQEGPCLLWNRSPSNYTMMLENHSSSTRLPTADSGCATRHFSSSPFTIPLFATRRRTPPNRA